MLPAAAEEDLGIDLEQPAAEEEDPDIESAVLCGRSQISIENAARYYSDHLSHVKKNPSERSERLSDSVMCAGYLSCPCAEFIMVMYHARALSSPRAEFGTPNFEFESCRTITENSARMDRATTKQEGEKRNYKIRMCKLTM